ncbi:GIY-YIG nuclease family protein [Hymenobacter pini]|uniref:GIY-YIG nuclease family protein n=1 Tax=Hymenobacter pini TaxID=2880879 RepID=UPI001CF58305|nr:GIY-YIG nuclease family protein [Hymenobacter pini]MCA8829253.1 GIY-YIG nuclease family protein [Hymenobacter pini]
MSFYVYILTNPARTVLYTGVNNNLERCLHEHNEGLGEVGKSTGHYQCNLLVYFEDYPEAKQAVTREKQIKNWTRSKKEYLINLFNPNWSSIDLQTWNG